MGSLEVARKLFFFQDCCRIQKEHLKESFRSFEDITQKKRINILINTEV